MSDAKPGGRKTTAVLSRELDEARGQLQTLQQQVERGLRFVHVLASNNQGALREIQATVNGLGHTLAEHGQVVPDEVQKARMAYARASSLPDRRVHCGLDIDKYGEESKTVEIDCASRYALCRAACCRLGYVLGTQDLDEGVLKWDYGNPYVIRKDANGWCSHLGGDCKCTVFQQRPLSCRRYDCRGNAEIWIDFDRRIPNPKVQALPPLAGGDNAAGDGSGKAENSGK